MYETGGAAGYMAIYVGFRNEDMESRIASQSWNRLKKRMRKKPGDWLVVKLAYRWTEDLVAAVIESPLKLKLDDANDYKVSPKGRVQKVGRRAG